MPGPMRPMPGPVPPPRRGPSPWLWVIILVPVGVALLAFLAMFVLFARISSGPAGPPGTGPRNETFSAQLAGDTTVYAVTVRSPDGVGDDAEGSLTVRTDAQLRGVDGLDVSITAQAPQGMSIRFTGVGREEGIGSKSFRRSARFAGFVACSGCEYRFEVAVTSPGSAVSTGLVFEGSTSGKTVPAGLGPTTATVTGRHTVEGAAAKRVALDPEASAGETFRVWHVGLSGPDSAIGQTQVRLVAVGDPGPAPVLGGAGASVMRGDVQGPSPNDTTPTPTPATRTSGLNGWLALRAEGCTADCTVGLWVVASNDLPLELELHGRGEGVRVDVSTVRSEVVDATIPVDDSVARKAVVLSAGERPPPGLQAIVMARLGLDGSGVALGRLGNERLEVRTDERQGELVTGPCVAAACNASTNLAVTGTAPATVQLTAEVFFVGPSDEPLSDAVSLAVR